MARRTRRNGVVRVALVAHRHRFADRWPTPGARANVAAAEAGEPVTTTSDELLSALLPVDETWATRFVERPPRRYVLTERDELLVID
jgi:hypothetical protein